MVRRYIFLLALFILPVAAPARAELRYTCEQLGDMAARFLALKTRGYALEDVLGVVQQAAAGNAHKEDLLSNLAIEIFVDADIATEAQARRLAGSRCRATD